MRVSCVNDSYCEGKGRKLCAFFLLYIQTSRDAVRRTRSSRFFLYATQKLRRSRDISFCTYYITIEKRYTAFRWTSRDAGTLLKNLRPIIRILRSPSLCVPNTINVKDLSLVILNCENSCILYNYCIIVLYICIIYFVVHPKHCCKKFRKGSVFNL